MLSFSNLEKVVEIADVVQGKLWKVGGIIKRCDEMISHCLQSLEKIIDNFRLPIHATVIVFNAQ